VSRSISGMAFFGVPPVVVAMTFVVIKCMGRVFAAQFVFYERLRESLRDYSSSLVFLAMGFDVGSSSC
jgi:hypothetical protein